MLDRQVEVSAISGVRSRGSTPIQPRVTWPSLSSASITWRAVSTGMAKPMPRLPPLRRVDGGVDADQPAFGVDQRAARVAGVDGRVGLDEVLEGVDMPSWLRPSALTMPEVTVWPTPNGLPMASTTSPTCSASTSPKVDHRQLVELDLEHRQVGLGVGADQPGARPGGRRRAAPRCRRRLRPRGCWSAGSPRARRSRPSPGRSAAAPSLPAGRRRRSGTTGRRLRPRARGLAGDDADHRRRGPLGGLAVAAGGRGRAARCGDGAGTGVASWGCGHGRHAGQPCGFSVATTNNSASATVTVWANRSQSLRNIGGAGVQMRGCAGRRRPPR